MSVLTSEDLARLVKAKRAEQGLTQAQLAERMDCSRQAISQAENEGVGSNMDGLRAKIIEELTGQKLEQAWRFTEENRNGKK